MRMWMKTGLGVLIALLVAGCATAPRATVPAPAEVPVLEAQYRSSPGDATLRARLGAAYRAAGRPNDAVTLLRPFATAGTALPAGSVTLAGAYEDLQQFGEARTIYASLSETATGRLQREVSARMLALDRLELQAAVRNAIAREEELRAATPPADAVGVFPFLFESTNESLAPLSRALAALLGVDLAQTDRLRVVERAQLQYLLDELQLAESSRVDTLTAARAGHLVGAGRIVQGRIDGAADEIRLQAAVVTVGGAEAVRVLDEEGRLNSLFDMEKQLALDIYDALGIQLTVAERQRVNRRQTQNIQALLAFGYGLEAADAGRWDEALERFAEASRLDANFELNQDWITRVEATRTFEAQGSQGLLQIALGGPTDLPDWLRVRQRFIEIERIVPDPLTRDAVTQVLGTEGLDRGLILDVIIRRPTGGSR